MFTNLEFDKKSRISEMDNTEVVLSKIPRVLIVEDDLDSVKVMERLMQKINENVEVTWVSSSEEAYRQLRSLKYNGWHKPYDLIVADVFLEGSETGIDLYGRVTKIFPDVPFVATSSTSILRFLDNTSFYTPIFLKKPVNPQEWLPLLREYIS